MESCQGAFRGPCTAYIKSDEVSNCLKQVKNYLHGLWGTPLWNVFESGYKITKL
jgi:hypothetical protein